MAQPAFAADAIEGAGLGLAWGVPFVGLLLSIALGPLLAPRAWHAHYGKVALGWTVLTLVALAFGFGPGPALTRPCTLCSSNTCPSSSCCSPSSRSPAAS